MIFSVLSSYCWKYKEVKYGIWAFGRIEKDPAAAADNLKLVHEFSFFVTLYKLCMCTKTDRRVQTNGNRFFLAPFPDKNLMNFKNNSEIWETRSLITFGPSEMLNLSLYAPRGGDINIPQADFRSWLLD